MNKLYRKYSNKRWNAKQEGIDFFLTYDEFKELANKARITHEQMSIKGYHLARYGDIGPYSIDNSRFIPASDNLKEKKISERSRLASKENIKLVAGKNRTPEALEKKVKSMRKLISNLDKEGRVRVLHELSDEEIARRHEIIKGARQGFGMLTRASRILNIKPQVIGRFLKKYPIKNCPVV